MEFEYLLYPFAGPFDAANALRMVQEAQTGIWQHQAESLPKTTSFCQLQSNAALITALKPAADGNGGILRLWNPGATPVKESLHFSVDLKTAERCTIDERSSEPIRTKQDGSFVVEVPARGLTTVRFTW
jgi:alpha-mannosidase